MIYAYFGTEQKKLLRRNRNPMDKTPINPYNPNTIFSMEWNRYFDQDVKMKLCKQGKRYRAHKERPRRNIILDFIISVERGEFQ